MKPSHLDYLKIMSKILLRFTSQRRDVWHHCDNWYICARNCRLKLRIYDAVFISHQIGLISDCPSVYMTLDWFYIELASCLHENALVSPYRSCVFKRKRSESCMKLISRRLRIRYKLDEEPHYQFYEPPVHLVCCAECAMERKVNS